MRAGWNTHPLGELCRIEIGGTPSRSSAKYWDKEKATSNVWLSIADMPKTLHASISRSSEHLSDGGAERVKIVRAGTLLVSFKLTLGRLAYAGTDLRTNEAIAALSLLENSRIKKEFLYWYLTFFDWQKAAEGEEKVKGKTLNKAKLSCIPVLVPPIPEQLRIVAILDEAFAGIATVKANTEKSLRNAVDVFETKLSQVFNGNRAGWKVRRLDEVCAITSALVDPRQPEYIDAVHVGAGNIESKTGRLIDLRTSRDEALISGKFPFDETMVLYSKIRPYLEKVVRPDFSGICSADMYPLAPIGGRIARDFLYWLLLSQQFTEYAINGSARAGMPKVNREHLFQFEFSLPEVEEQNRIVAVLDSTRAEVSHLQSLYTRKLAALDELKQSLLHQAFSGQM